MSTTRKKILFVCVGNSCRSQMAEGFATHYARQRGLDVEIHSAGTHPAGSVHQDAIAVMREKGIDISQQSSKSVALFDLRTFDYVIAMGCLEYDICPANFHGVHEDWGIPDPIGRGLEFYRKVRDMIEERVLVLFDTMIKHGNRR